MSEQNEKLTAEQKAETLLTSFLNNVYKDTPKNLQPDFVYIHDSAVRKLMKTLMLMFYAQQVEHATDELRKELEAVKMDSIICKECDTAYHIDEKGCPFCLKYKTTISRMKDDKISELQTKLDEAQRQRDEAVNFLTQHVEEINWASRVLVKNFLSSLSSGEAKQEFKCVHGLPSDATCIGCLDDSHKPPPKSLTDKK